MKRLNEAVEMLLDLPSVIDTLAQATEIDRCTVVLDKCRVVVGGHCGALALKDDSGTWNVTASSSVLVHQLQHSRVSRGLSAANRVESAGGPVAIDIDPLDGAFDGSVTELFNLGYRYEYAFPLNGVDRFLGAVILLDERDRPLADDDLRLVQAATDVMGRALSCLREKDAFNRQVAQLSSALESRIVIEQAKGVIVARSGIDLGEAFLVLRRAARDTRESVADVAARIVGGAPPV